MARSYFNPSVEDREMFAYNATYQKRQEERAIEQARIKAHLAHAENRIHYSLDFADTDDQAMRTKAMTAFYKWVGVASDEGHY